MDIKGGLLLWFTIFLIKSQQAVVLIRMKIMSVPWTWLKIYAKQLLENIKKEQLIQDLKIIFGMI